MKSVGMTLIGAGLYLWCHRYDDDTTTAVARWFTLAWLITAFSWALTVAVGPS